MDGVHPIGRIRVGYYLGWPHVRLRGTSYGKWLTGGHFSGVKQYSVNNQPVEPFSPICLWPPHNLSRPGIYLPSSFFERNSFIQSKSAKQSEYQVLKQTNTLLVEALPLSLSPALPFSSRRVFRNQAGNTFTVTYTEYLQPQSQSQSQSVDIATST